MSDADRLRSKRDRLAAPETRGQLVVRLGSGGPAARAAFCEFIDEVILARRVSVVSQTGDVLAVDVSNRRLLRIEHLPGDLIRTFPVGEALRPDDADQIGRATDAIGAFLDISGPVTVSEAPLAQRPPSDMLGRSAAALAAAFGVALYADGADATPEPADDTDPPGSLEELALAVRHRDADGAIGPTAGHHDLFRSPDAPVVPRLAEVFRGVLHGPALVAVYSRPGADVALLIADRNGDRTEAVVERSRIGGAITALDLGSQAD